jgi:hypothetical protein
VRHWRSDFPLSAKVFVPLVCVAVIAAGCGRAPGQEETGALSSDTTLATTQPVPNCGASAGPTARLNPNLINDSGHGRFVLFGGDVEVAPSMGSANDTWLLSSGCWSEVQSASAPPSRAGAAADYDPIHNVVVLYGGVQSAPGKTPTFLADTWLLNGTTWSQVQPAIAPSLTVPVGAFDIATGQFVVFGAPQSGAPAETWAWDGTHWFQLHPQVSPIARIDATMAYDSGAHKLVLFGGFNAGVGTLGDTWTWDGTNWQEEHPASSPSPRIGASMCGGQQLILFGGSDISSPAGAETWTWVHGNWRQVATTHKPTARRNAACARGDAGVVVFGGQGTAGQPLSDRWSFTGSDWSAG